MCPCSWDWTVYFHIFSIRSSFALLGTRTWSLLDPSLYPLTHPQMTTPGERCSALDSPSWRSPVLSPRLITFAEAVLGVSLNLTVLLQVQNQKPQMQYHLLCCFSVNLLQPGHTRSPPLHLHRHRWPVTQLLQHFFCLQPIPGGEHWEPGCCPTLCMLIRQSSTRRKVVSGGRRGIIFPSSSHLSTALKLLFSKRSHSRMQLCHVEITTGYWFVVSGIFPWTYCLFSEKVIGMEHKCTVIKRYSVILNCYCFF